MPYLIKTARGYLCRGREVASAELATPYSSPSAAQRAAAKVTELEPVIIRQTSKPFPAPGDIKAVRKAAGLSQSAAAGLIYSTRRTLQDWEAGIAGMHPGLLELLRIKTGQDRQPLGPPSGA